MVWCGRDLRFGLPFSSLSGFTGLLFKTPTTQRLFVCRARLRAVLSSMMEANMATGTVKWFNPTKGFGFIQPEDGGKDVFVHISAVEKAGMDTLQEGQRVSYEVISERGKSAAGSLQTA